MPNLNSSIDSDNPDDSDTEGQHIDDKKKRKRAYKKKADKKTGVKYPVCERISATGLPSDEPILSQAETDKNLAYMHKSSNMRTEIQGVSITSGNIVYPLQGHVFNTQHLDKSHALGKLQRIRPETANKI